MLAYDYSAGSARLDDLPEIPISPHLYVLCDRCATSLRAPRGWILDDRRGPAPTSPAPTPVIEPPAAAAVEAAVAVAVEAAVAVEPELEPQLEDVQRQLVFGYSA